MPETLLRVRGLLPEIGKRSEEIEQARGLPADVVDALTAAGCFRMLVPARAGGSGLGVADVLPVLEALASADGSTGWSVGQVALSQLIIDCAAEEVSGPLFAEGPDLLAAGAVAPKGRATRGEGGWRVAGQWPFVTGCVRARWFYLNCVVVADRAIQTLPDGTPATRIVFLPAEAVRVVDTWQVMGLRGTGSHDVAIDGVSCPLDRGFSLEPGTPATERAVFNIAESSLIVASVAVGIAGGALTEVTELATDGKRPALSRKRLAASPLFQDRLGEAHTLLRAARGLLYAESETARGVASRMQSGGEPSTAIERAAIRTAAASVIGLARSVVDTAHALGGGTTVYDSSPLQRRLRDMHTATQHFVAGRDSYGSLGALLVGEEPPSGAF